MRIFIEPTEPLLFRTGRPFHAGEDNFAETLFPPTPETLQGALRSAIAVQWGETRAQPLRDLDRVFNAPDLKRIIGSLRNYGQFRLTGMSLGRRDPQTKLVERLFPPPAHLEHGVFATPDGKKQKQIVRLQPAQLDESDLTNLPPGCRLLIPDLHGLQAVEKSEAFTAWLTPKGLASVLNDDSFPDGDDAYMAANQQIYTFESRLGIGIDHATNTTKEGYLYQMQMVRMQSGYGFVVDVEFGDELNGARPDPISEQRSETLSALHFLDHGWLTLGGEQRAARFEVLSAAQCVPELSIDTRRAGNVLYFATPAYFSSGWISSQSATSPQPGRFPAQPIAAAVPHYESIGGWFLDPKHAGGSGKTTRRCVPAGSVYFFDHPIHIEQPLTEYGWQIGYGITYPGEWKNK